MKSKKLLEYIKSSDLVVPGILLANYKDLGMNEKEVLFMSLLMTSPLIPFDPIFFKDRLGFEVEETMEIMSNLSSKKYVDLIVKKENNKMKEYMSIDLFYERLLMYLMDEDDSGVDADSEIYEIIESEFGRTLSPMEYETISGWLNANIDEGLIKEALKEAVLNGVNNLKYIDKILYEWTKKGYKKASDVKKKNARKEPDEINLFEYDWLDEND